MSELVSVKVATVGDSGVGKSSVVSRLVRGESAGLSEEVTVAAAYARLTVGDKYVLEIWDTAGSERFRSFLPMYLRGAKVILAMYDVTCYNTLKRVHEDHDRMVRDIPELKRAIWILVGNKMDMPVGAQEVSFRQAQEVAEDWAQKGRSDWEELSNVPSPYGNPLHVRVSAKNGENLHRLVDLVVSQLHSNPQLVAACVEARHQEAGVVKLTAEPTRGSGGEFISNLKGKAKSCC